MNTVSFTVNNDGPGFPGSMHCEPVIAPSVLLNGQLSDHSTRGTHCRDGTRIVSVTVKRYAIDELYQVNASAGLFFLVLMEKVNDCPSVISIPELSVTLPSESSIEIKPNGVVTLMNQ